MSLKSQIEIVEARRVALKSEAEFIEWLFGKKVMERWDRWSHIYADMKVVSQ